MRRRTHRVAHVVQTVEKGDQIEILLRITLGRRDLEAGVCRDAVLPGMRRSVLDRAWVKVVTDELRLRKRLRHQYGGPAVPAPDVGDFGAALQFCNHAVERRKPIAHQSVVVAGPKEAGNGTEETGRVIA